MNNNSVHEFVFFLLESFPSISVRNLSKMRLKMSMVKQSDPLLNFIFGGGGGKGGYCRYSIVNDGVIFRVA